MKFPSVTMISEGYGVGFNIVFNITPQPNIWSGNYIILLEPQVNLQYYDDLKVAVTHRFI